MPVSTVEVYEKLKPSLGEEGTKALLSYVEETVGGEVATKNDLFEMQVAFEEKLQGVREEMLTRFEKVEGRIAGIEAEVAVIKATMATKEDIHQLRLLLVIVIAAIVLLNPKVWEVIGNIFGVVK
jgi:hypothetical protein